MAKTFYGLTKILQQAVQTTFDAIDDIPKTVVYHSTSTDPAALQAAYDIVTGTVTRVGTDYTIEQVVLARFKQSEVDKTIVIETDMKMIFPAQQLPVESTSEDTITYTDPKTGLVRRWEVVKLFGEPSNSVTVLQVRTSGSA